MGQYCGTAGKTNIHDIWHPSEMVIQVLVSPLLIQLPAQKHLEKQQKMTQVPGLPPWRS